ncbi:uncharacterized protein DS421_11g344940 [Arachis hypogaea]|nr:uncharacterized protein DS421_11g344940 [Arachis hypogaea]
MCRTYSGKQIFAVGEYLLDDNYELVFLLCKFICAGSILMVVVDALEILIQCMLEEVLCMTTGFLDFQNKRTTFFKWQLG